MTDTLVRDWECPDCDELVVVRDEGQLDEIDNHWKHCSKPSEGVIARRKRAGLDPSVLPVSPSRLTTYEMCPRRAWFEQIDPKKRATASGDAANLGTAVHAYAEGDDVTADLPIEMVEDFEWMTRTLDRLNADDPLPHLKREEQREVTLSFTYTLPDGRTAEVEGRADRLYLYEDASVLVDDFKTGRIVPEDEEELEANLQGRMYLVGARRLFPFATRFMFRQSQLRTNRVVASRWWRAETVETFDKLVFEKVKRYAGDKTWRPIPGRHCHYCDFVHRCTVGKDYLGTLPFQITVLEAPQTLTTPEEVATAAMALDQAQAGVKRLSAALREATKRAHVGPVDVGDGRWIGWKQKTRESIKDIEGAVALMQQEGVDPWDRLSFNGRKKDGFKTYLKPLVVAEKFMDCAIHKEAKSKETYVGEEP